MNSTRVLLYMEFRYFSHKKWTKYSTWVLYMEFRYFSHKKREQIQYLGTIFRIFVVMVCIDHTWAAVSAEGGGGENVLSGGKGVSHFFASRYSVKFAYSVLKLSKSKGKGGRGAEAHAYLQTPTKGFSWVGSASCLGGGGCRLTCLGFLPNFSPMPGMAGIMSAIAKLLHKFAHMHTNPLRNWPRQCGAHHFGSMVADHTHEKTFCGGLQIDTGLTSPLPPCLWILRA